jgi:hypothetical protein
LVRAWVIAGKPAPKVKPIGSLEKWTDTAGGILENAGIQGFLSNAGEMYAESDHESTEWEAFITVLLDLFPDPFTTAEVAEELAGKTWNDETRASMPSVRALRLKSVLPEKLLEVADRDIAFRRRLGTMLGERVDRRYGQDELHLRRGTLLHGNQRWEIKGPE